MIAAIDPLLHVNTTVHEFVGWTITSINGVGDTTQYGYDLAGQQIRVDKLIRETQILAVENGYRRVLDVRMKPEDFSKLTNAQMDELLKVAQKQRVEVRFTAYP